MRSRKTVHVDTQTGQAITTLRALPDARWPDRLKQLVQSLPPIENPTEKVAIIRCDGCNQIEQLDFDDPKLPEGWIDTENGDFCPRCQ